MSCPSHYQINVAKSTGQSDYTKAGFVYQHFFDTGISLQYESEVIEVLRDFQKRFPFPDFKVTCTLWKCQGVSYELLQK